LLSTFDKLYRQAERKYKYEFLEELDETVINNPKKFWSMLKNLGPRKKSGVCMEVYDDNGVVCSDTDFVVMKWKNEYEKLFNHQPEPGVFDDEFYKNCVDNLMHIESHNDVLPGINHAICINEVKRALDKAKLGKSVGVDNLPNAVLKSENTVRLLYVLFDKIFESSIIPSTWKLSILHPIPKSSLLDPRLPLKYRGISLLSTVYKIFSTILNNRLNHCSEEHNLLADEQNGFRRDRSCLDHVYSLNTILRNRKRNGLSTFVGFVDMEKAFDRVDRNLLFYKLREKGIGGKLYNCIKSIYQDSKACVSLNGHLTPSFFTNFGVKQGDGLSPTLFNLYLNDLVSELKSRSRGVHLDDDMYLQCLLYADDIVLISESEGDLQMMFDVINEWCKKWRMVINSGLNKTNVVHFRPQSCPLTEFVFKCGNDDIIILQSYKYLGIVMDEFLDYNKTANVLAYSATHLQSCIILVWCLYLTIVLVCGVIMLLKKLMLFKTGL